MVPCLGISRGLRTSNQKGGAMADFNADHVTAAAGGGGVAALLTALLTWGTKYLKHDRQEARDEGAREARLKVLEERHGETQAALKEMREEVRDGFREIREL